MNCGEVARRLQQFVDRELNAEEVVEVRRHLDECPPCHHLFEFEGDMRRLVRRACSEVAPTYLRERILEYRVKRVD